MNHLLKKLFSRPRFVGRGKTRDTAITYRMQAGFPGDVNRSHPASIEPCLIDASAPPTAFGQPVVIDATTQGVRPLAATDTALTDCYGITVRPYPFQVSSATNYGAAAQGAATPPASGAIDVLRSGYIMGKLNVGSTAVKGAAVYVRIAATSGAHIQGQFESAADGTNTIAINATFNGGADANGNVEIAFNV